ncbi:MAG: glucosamine-6-phosphate deaminase [Defluviitaleaceae bacterium]|nr:glucosamine-6-phosphate deaminase [Defluviitaleaceae bacterium]
MKIIITDNYNTLSAAAGDIIAQQIKAKPDSVLGLATGSTPIGTYKHLVEAGLDFSNVQAFNLDEYYPIPRTNDQSYYYFMNENLFSQVNIDKKNTHIQNGEASDPQAECQRYEDAIKGAGGIDLQLLGLGLNGHIGFNEPDSHFPKATHHVALDESTIEANSRFFASSDDVPRHALTMGIGTIFNARKIVMLISGEAKADIAKAVIHGNIDPQIPASILQLHPDVTIILDKDAAKYVK